MEPEVVKDPIIDPNGGGEDEPSPTPELKPGEKTDPALLLGSLQEEREKRRLAEAEKARLEQELSDLKNNPDPDVYSEEGIVLKRQIDTLTDTIAVKEVVEQFPALKDKQTDFNEFRKQYPSVALEAVAKLFLSENGLLEAPKERKGLEKPSGGTRTQPQVGMTPDDITELRTTNFRKYSQLVREGKINP